MGNLIKMAGDDNGQMSVFKQTQKLANQKATAAAAGETEKKRKQKFS